jgi:hypothetical protein
MLRRGATLRSKAVEGDSVLYAIVFLASAGGGLIASTGRAHKRVELALNLTLMIAMGLLAFGYDPKVRIDFLVEASATACGLSFLFALVQYGRRELAEGEYDEPNQAR